MGSFPRHFLATLATAAAVLCGTTSRADSVGGDFNGDGYDDLAIGVRNDVVGGMQGAGAVNVIYGSAEGLSAVRDQWWHQHWADVLGTAQPGESVASVAYGDFNGDGFADLAFGVPHDSAGGVSAGSVNVLYGSSNRLTANADQRWHQSSANVLGAAEAGDAFGSAVVSGDFNGDGFADLAIGVPLEDVDGVNGAGAVNVLYGASVAAGLAAAGNQLWHKNTPGVLGAAAIGDAFGSALAAGDFNQDGFEDLAVGVPYQEVNGAALAGAVHVLFGSAEGLTALHDQLWHQASPGVAGSPDFQDFFGSALTSGDFNGDDVQDLAIGSLREGIGVPIGPGAVHVLYGFQGTGLAAAGSELLQDDAGSFGAALAAGDFDHDGIDDLAIGAPTYDGGGLADSVGAVRVRYGSGAGLTARRAQLWTQDSPGVLDQAEYRDLFGASLRAGDFDGNGFDDLAIGATRETLGPVIPYRAGAVNVLYGAFGGLNSTGNQFWHQDSVDIDGVAQDNEFFGNLGQQVID